MKPAGHEPTWVDTNPYPATPQRMYRALKREREARIFEEIDFDGEPLQLDHTFLFMNYTHYSRDEYHMGEHHFERRFSRGAVDPFAVPASMRNLVDSSGHVRFDF